MKKTCKTVFDHIFINSNFLTTMEEKCCLNQIGIIPHTVSAICIKNRQLSLMANDGSKTIKRKLY